MKIKKEIPVKVAVVQMEPVVGETERNLANCLAKAAEAADNGAQLIVLPELCVSGYVFANREEAFALSEPIPGGKSCQVIGKSSYLVKNIVRDTDLSDIVHLGSFP